MRRSAVWTCLSILLALVWLVLAARPAAALEKGTVTGKIERINDKFVRDYETLDYKGQKKWAKWGKGLESIGWIVVQGESGELKDKLLLVVDTNTRIEGPQGQAASFSDFAVEGSVEAAYQMGWDALHADHVKILSPLPASRGEGLPAKGFPAPEAEEEVPATPTVEP